MHRSLSPLLIASAFALAACTTPMVGMAPSPELQALPGNAPSVAGKTEVLWLGQSAMRIRTPGGKVIVVDPWLTTNPKTPAEWKDLHALGKVDMILVTHAHFDHFSDAPALAKLNNAPIWNAGGLGQPLVTLGMVPAALAQRFGKGGTIEPFGPGGVKVTAVEAQHSSELVWKDAAGKDETHFGGEPVGYVLEMENGFRIYHMGDTALFGDLRLIGDLYHPDLVLIPIGGHFTMGPQDAARALRDMLHPRYAIPMHYGTFPVLRGTPQELISSMGGTPSPRILVPQPGQKYEF